MMNRILIAGLLLLLPIAARAQNYRQQLAAARAAYFQAVDGGNAAAAKARAEFSALHAARPDDAVISVYLGSLDLLDAAHTWAVWKKHSLSEKGLGEMDNAVDQAPGNLEVRFIRAATTWSLPSFFHRRQQSEADIARIAPRAEAAAHNGTLTPMLASAALDYYGRMLAGRGNHIGAVQAFEAAIRVDSTSPGAKDASKRLRGE